MSEKKKSDSSAPKKREYKKRTQTEIAMTKADKCVELMDKTINAIGDLRIRINELPSDSFSEMAKGFNKFIESIPDFSTRVFAETEKPPTPEQLKAQKEEKKKSRGIFGRKKSAEKEKTKADKGSSLEEKAGLVEEKKENKEKVKTNKNSKTKK